MKHQLTASAIGFLTCVACIPSGVAAVMSGRAYEPFDYPSAPSPNNQLIPANNLNGGYGWNSGGDSSPNAATANWGNAVALPAIGGLATGHVVTSPGLSYAATGYPTASGNTATIDATGGANNNVSRSLGQLVDSGSFYFSYLTDRNVPTNRTMNLAFFGPANGIAGTPGNSPERIAIGQIGNATAGSATTGGNIAALANNQNPAGLVNSASPIAYGTNVPHLIAGRIDFNPAGNDTFTLYVDPTDVTSEPTTPYLQTSGFELTSINSVRPFAGNAATINGVANAAASGDFDELRFGTSWHDVMTSTPTPPRYRFTQIDYPNGNNTECNGISNSGVITGDYTDAFGVVHGFTLNGSTFTSVDYPGQGFATANGMNASGQVVGLFGADVNATKKAYTRIGSTYTDLATIASSPLAGAQFAGAFSINVAGHIVGEYVTNNLDKGYLYNPNATPQFTTLLPSGPGITPDYASAIGINNNDDIVGFYGTSGSGVEHAFLLSGGVYTNIDPVIPGQSVLFPEGQGINDSGQVVGDFQSSFAVYHGFIKNGSAYTQFDYPSANDTRAFALNNAGQIVGLFEDSGGQIHGFLATPLAAEDFNGDGVIDGADLARWAANFGLSAGALKGDGDASGNFAVDGGDFLQWQTARTGDAAVSPQAAGVPEPATAVLLLISLVGPAIFVGRRP